MNLTIHRKYCYYSQSNEIMSYYNPELDFYCGFNIKYMEETDDFDLDEDILYSIQSKVSDCIFNDGYSFSYKTSDISPLVFMFTMTSLVTSEVIPAILSKYGIKCSRSISAGTTYLTFASIDDLNLAKLYGFRVY